MTGRAPLGQQGRVPSSEAAHELQSSVGLHLDIKENAHAAHSPSNTPSQNTQPAHLLELRQPRLRAAPSPAALGGVRRATCEDHTAQLATSSATCWRGRRAKRRRQDERSERERKQVCGLLSRENKSASMLVDGQEAAVGLGALRGWGARHPVRPKPEKHPRRHRAEKWKAQAVAVRFAGCKDHRRRGKSGGEDGGSAGADGRARRVEASSRVTGSLG